MISDFHKPTYLPKNQISFLDALLIKSKSGRKIIRLTLPPNKKRSKKDVGGGHRRGGTKGNDSGITREENQMTATNFNINNLS